MWDLCSLLLLKDIFCAVEESAVLLYGDQVFVGWDFWSGLTRALFPDSSTGAPKLREAAGSVCVQPSLQMRSRVLSFCSAGTGLFHACK